jgi:hypothetical protein
MLERSRTTVAIAALLALLAIAGTRAGWPSVTWKWPAHRALVVGSILEIALAGLLIALRWRRPRPRTTGQETLPLRLRRLLSAVLIFGLVATPVIIAFGEVHAVTAHPPKTFLRAKGHLRRVKPIKIPKESQLRIPFGEILLYLIIAVIVLAIITVVVRALRGLSSRDAVSPAGDFDVAEVSEEDLARAVESGQRALREFDDARLAIIRCYLAMEQSLADAGTVRDAAETPDELLRRAVAARLVPAAPAGLLTRLFYEARFSTHDMPLVRRDEAIRALDELAAGLPAEDPL